MKISDYFILVNKICMYIYTHIYLVSKIVDKDKNHLPCPTNLPIESLPSLGRPLESGAPWIRQSIRMIGVGLSWRSNG